MELQKASRRKVKLRVGLGGPSGSGKTYSALLLARGLASSWEKVAIIDTENGSGEMYSDLGDYMALTLTAPFSPERFIEAVKVCEKEGIEVIVIDSMTHEWDGEGGCLQINDKLANAKYKGNTWAAWSETTPRHQAFINKILTSPCHVVTTVRSKTETVQENGKVKKIGMKEIQRDGYEYELTVNFSIDRDHHFAITSKDRTGMFIDVDPFLINQGTGEKLLKWSQSGVESPTVVRDDLIAMIELAETQADLKMFKEKMIAAKLGKANESMIVKALTARFETLKKMNEETQERDEKKKKKSKQITEDELNEKVVAGEVTPYEAEIMRDNEEVVAPVDNPKKDAK